MWQKTYCDKILKVLDSPNDTLNMSAVICNCIPIAFSTWDIVIWVAPFAGDGNINRSPELLAKNVSHIW